MSHANAALTPRHRLKVVQLVVDDRYPAGESMIDRPSRPRRQPGRTSPAVVRRVLELRWRKRLGPVQLSARCGVAASTVHKILVRNRVNRLNYVCLLYTSPSPRD